MVNQIYCKRVSLLKTIRFSAKQEVECLGFSYTLFIRRFCYWFVGIYTVIAASL